jgi:transformation/transcription domain-associated protein
LAKRKESRQRNLLFHLPVIVPLAPNVRLVQDGASYVSLQEVYEDHCERRGVSKDAPISLVYERFKQHPSTAAVRFQRTLK